MPLVIGSNPIFRTNLESTSMVISSLENCGEVTLYKVRFLDFPPFYPDIAQLGRAFGLGPKGREFKSYYLDH